MKKRVLILILAVVMLVSSLTTLGGCSKAPEYYEIEARLRELVESSYEINKLLFGEGLPTYERVYDRTVSSYKIHEDHYYYEIDDDQLGRIVAYRSITPKKDENGKLMTEFSYAQVSRSPIEGKTAIFSDDRSKIYCYEIEYEEKQYDFYYVENDPENYDYVKLDSGYLSVSDIKAAAERVYSRNYLESTVYVALFTGASATNDNSLSSLSARYIEYDSENMGVALMQSNIYPPLVTETRLFDFSTAKMVKPSNKKLVSIDVETYLPSSPEQRITVTVTLIMQDGQWFLDSGTY